MREFDREREPMCETSEPGERLIAEREMPPISSEIGRRVLKVFGYQRAATIARKLRSNRSGVKAVINGKELPSTEMLLGIRRVTGVSLDWLLTGQGSKYPSTARPADPTPDTVTPTMWYSGEERHRPRRVL